MKMTNHIALEFLFLIFLFGAMNVKVTLKMRPFLPPTKVYLRINLEIKKCLKSKKKKRMLLVKINFFKFFIFLVLFFYFLFLFFIFIFIYIYIFFFFKKKKLFFLSNLNTGQKSKKF